MIDCKDVFGRRVLMSSNRWTVHVLSQRAWMEGWEERVRDTLMNPSFIHIDRYDAGRECFYKVGTPVNPQRLLKVIVEFDAEGTGVVVTAYPSRNVPTGERHKWP